MKILFLTHRFYPDIGGIEVHSRLLAEEFARCGHQLRVVTWSEGHGKANFEFEIIRRPSIKSLIDGHRWADVVYENNPCIRLSWPASLMGKSSVVSFHTWIRRANGSNTIFDRLKSAWLRRSPSAIAISDRIREECCPSAVVIGNPYNPNLFQRLSHVHRDRDFAFLGRLVSDKGCDLAIKAICKINQSRKHAKQLNLTVIGEGDEEQGLKNLASELGVQGCVDFTGSLTGEALVEVLNRHRFIWIPSVWEEPFGNVALEGMACGCIPIASNGGGLPDAVGNAGVLFERSNLSDMVERSLLLEDDEAKQDLLRNAAVDHLANHEARHIANRYLDVIQSAHNG